MTARRWPITLLALLLMPVAAMVAIPAPMGAAPVGAAPVGAAPGSAGQAGAGPAAFEECSGVTVVVDDGEDVEAQCAPNGVSGLQALEEAGFSVYTIDNGGFVCQIDGKPDKSVCKDSGNQTSWYYFYAGSDGQWQYAALGAGNRTVEDGGYEGWTFGPKEPPDYDMASSAAPQDDSDGSGASTSNEASPTSDDSVSLATWIAAAVVIAVVVASIIAAVRRRQ